MRERETKLSSPFRVKSHNWRDDSQNCRYVLCLNGVESSLVPRFPGGTWIRGLNLGTRLVEGKCRPFIHIAKVRRRNLSTHSLNKCNIIVYNKVSSSFSHAGLHRKHHTFQTECSKTGGHRWRRWKWCNTADRQTVVHLITSNHTTFYHLDHMLFPELHGQLRPVQCYTAALRHNSCMQSHVVITSFVTL